MVVRVEAGKSPQPRPNDIDLKPSRQPESNWRGEAKPGKQGSGIRGTGPVHRPLSGTGVAGEII